MNALLIAPGDRPAVAALAKHQPLVCLPILGSTLVERWLAHLAERGARTVFLVATDRPHQVRQVVGDGTRWGLRVEVIPEPAELRRREARLKYSSRGPGPWLAAPDDVTVADHLPGMSQHPLFESYAGWAAAVRACLTPSTARQRLGMREVQPGVWVGRRTRMAPGVKLVAPCWVGDHVEVESGVSLGPEAVVEDRSVVAAGTTVARSVVGPETFVGRLANLHESLALGRTLVNWRTESAVTVADPFVLASLTREPSPWERVGLVERLAAGAVLLLTLPLALLAAAGAKARGRRAVRTQVAIRPQREPIPFSGVEMAYYELAVANRWLARWPQLWEIVRGRFHWVGNRPLDRYQAAHLTTDFERLGLTAPLGLVSLAEVQGCDQPLSDEACAHASLYAALRGPALNAGILVQAVWLLLLGFPYARLRDHLLLAPRRLRPEPSTHSL